jgi:hypothetical protein
MGEVDREDRVGLRGQELSPGRAGPAGSGIDPGGLQDLPHRRRGDPMAEADQLALDASIPPAWVLPSQPQHQCPDGLRDGWSASHCCRAGQLNRLLDGPGTAAAQRNVRHVIRQLLSRHGRNAA